MKFNFYLDVLFILFLCSAIFFIFRLIEVRNEKRKRKSSLIQCFHCGENAVAWDSDFNFEDFGYEGEGIVHICHCTNCGAEIEYKIPVPDGDEDE